MFYPGTRQPGLGQYHLATSTIEFSNNEVSHKPHGDRVPGDGVEPSTADLPATGHQGPGRGTRNEQAQGQNQGAV